MHFKAFSLYTRFHYPALHRIYFAKGKKGRLNVVINLDTYTMYCKVTTFTDLHLQ